MNQNILKIIFTTVFLILSTAAASAMDLVVGNIAISVPWARALPAVSVNGAAYVTVHNQGTEADRLVGASASVAAMAQLHDHVTEDGLMRMIHVADGVEIAPGDMVEFKPHGLHIMLMGLSEPLVADGHFMLRLIFEKAGEIEIMVPILKDPPAGGMTHDASQG